MSDLILVTGATGPTGKAAVRELRNVGARVRAFVHTDDARADALRDIGADVLAGDLLDLAAVRAATKGVTAAYFVYPIRSGLVDATAYFATSNTTRRTRRSTPSRRRRSSSPSGRT